MPIPARIACLDLDTFFVSVERLHNPKLIGVPVVVGGVGGRGVVTSASYEVRALGVRSGMAISEAQRLAPDAVFIPPRHGVYGPYAKRVREVLLRYTPAVQTASIDEFFLDFRGCENYWHRAGDVDEDQTIIRIVHEMQKEVRADTGLPASVGVGTTRAIAKMASGKAKPAGVVFVTGGKEAEFAGALPVRKLPGFGPVSEARLVGGGVTHLGQLLSPTEEVLLRFPGEVEATHSAVFPNHVPLLGRDRPAFQEHDPEGESQGSISNERTFREDIRDPRMVEDQVRALAERVCWRARKRGVIARTVHLKLRYSDFDTLTRSKTIAATSVDDTVADVAVRLLRAARVRKLPIRLVGVGLSNLLVPDPQLALPLSSQEAVCNTVDRVRAKYGFDAIRRGATR